MAAKCNLMIRPLTLTRFPRAIAFLGFNRVLQMSYVLCISALWPVSTGNIAHVVVDLREVFLPARRWEIFPGAPCALLVIVPHHFHIPNYFNQSFSHMDSSA